METLIASHDQVLANRVRDALGHVENLCSSCQVMSHESALVALQGRQEQTPLLVCFVSPAIRDEDIDLLKQLSLASRQRAQVVAVSSGYDPNTILRVMRSGAVDYLDIDKSLDKDLANLIERLKANQIDPSRPNKLFSVVAPVGGAGTSLIAVNLAVLCAQKDGECGLLDLHLRGGDLARLLQLSPRYTLASLAGKANVDMTMFRQSVVPHSSGVQLLASPEPFSDYRQITPPLVHRVVQCARATFPYVIVDLEDAEHPEQVRLLAASDQIIIPLRPDLVSLYRTLKFLEYLNRANVAADHITIVANRVGQPDELPTRRMAEILGLPINHKIPEDPVGANRSFNVGVPLVLANPKGDTAIRLGRLADGLRSPAGSPDAEQQPSRWRRRISSWASRLGAMTVPSNTELQPRQATT